MDTAADVAMRDLRDRIELEPSERANDRRHGNEKQEKLERLRKLQERLAQWTVYRDACQKEQAAYQNLLPTLETETNETVAEGEENPLDISKIKDVLTNGQPTVQDTVEYVPIDVDAKGEMMETAGLMEENVKQT